MEQYDNTIQTSAEKDAAYENFIDRFEDLFYLLGGSF